MGSRERISSPNPSSSRYRGDVDSISSAEEEVDLERIRLAAGQNFVSILNDPRAPLPEDDWGIMDLLSIDYWTTPTSAPVSPAPDITTRDFLPYTSKVSKPYRLFKAGQAQDATTEPEQGDEESLEDLSHVFSLVPSTFFEEDFRLDDADTFARAIPTDTSSALLAEKLSHYLDVVETQLVRRVSRRSEQFFHALSAYQSLSETVAEACGSIRLLRSEIQDVESRAVQPALRVAHLVRKRNNLRALLQKAETVASVRQAQSSVQLLLSSADYGRAVDILTGTQNVLSSSLIGVAAFRHLLPQLREMHVVTGRIVASEFSRIALRALSEGLTNGGGGVQSGGVEEAFSTESPTSPPSISSSSSASSLRFTTIGEVGAVASGLVRFGDAVLSSAVNEYRDGAAKLVKKIAREAVESCVSILSSEDSSLGTSGSSGGGGGGEDNLASLLRSLATHHYNFVLSSAADAVLAALRHAAKVHGELVDAVAATGPLELSFPLKTHLGLALKFVAEHAHARLGRVVAVRFSADGSSGPNSQFSTSSSPTAPAAPPIKEALEIQSIVSNFLTLCDALLPEPISAQSPLKGIVQAQGRSFLDSYHLAKVNELRLILESEAWAQAETPENFQAIITEIADKHGGSNQSQTLTAESAAASISAFGLDGSTQSMSSEAPDPLSPTPGGGGEIPVHPSGVLVPGPSGKIIKKGLEVSGRIYAVAPCVLLALKMIGDYVHCAAGMPFLSDVVVQRLVQILRLFNQQAAEQVLGAAAMRTAGLRSIMAKHIALAAQCVGFLISFVPLLRTHLEKTLNASAPPWARDMNAFVSECEEHRRKLYSKVAGIMVDRLDQQMKGIASYSWDDDTSPVPTPYIQAGAKECNVLAKILTQFWYPDQIKFVMIEVLGAYNRRLVDCLSKVDSSSPRAKRRMWDEVTYWKAQSLSGFTEMCGPEISVLVDEFLNTKLGGSRPPS